MDPLLKGQSFNFFVDEIFLVDDMDSDGNINEKSRGKNLFGAVLIPDINSSFFPPMHLRKVMFPQSFLSRAFYENYRGKFPDLLPPPDSYTFSSSIEEGNYYEIPTNLLPGQRLPLILSQEFHNILSENIVDSPYTALAKADEFLNLGEGLSLLNTLPGDEGNRELLLYCFNVGQGDSMLVIFPNKNVYIVDTNIYSGGNLSNYISTVQHILINNGLPYNEIKGLVITHKHIDHLRGAEKLLNRSEFNIDYFLINYDFDHDTNTVDSLMRAAKQSIKKHININGQGSFNEGNIKVNILNPITQTKSKTKGNNLNDSSIVLQLQYGENNIFLSGDAGYNIINNLIVKKLYGNNILKVSHHGSRTGTNENLIKKINPRYAYISAGNHDGFNHPHSESLTSLNNQNVDLAISKVDGSIVYTIESIQINKTKFKYVPNQP